MSACRDTRASGGERWRAECPATLSSPCLRRRSMRQRHRASDASARQRFPRRTALAHTRPVGPQEHTAKRAWRTLTGATRTFLEKGVLARLRWRSIAHRRRTGVRHRRRTCAIRRIPPLRLRRESQIMRQYLRPRHRTPALMRLAGGPVHTGAHCGCSALRLVRLASVEMHQSRPIMRYFVSLMRKSSRNMRHLMRLMRQRMQTERRASQARKTWRSAASRAWLAGRRKPAVLRHSPEDP
jgi:hypothetical protein